jgi:hypothetical protein
MTKSNPTETRAASIFKDENDILVITMKDCGKMDEYDVIDVNLVLRHVSGDKPAYKLLDARANWSMDKKAKERAKLENTITKTSARAIIVSNVVKATLFEFLQSFSKFDYPQKTFSDKDEAYAWLLALKKGK